MDYPGNLFVIAAPSGAGKSSLVKALLAQDARLQLSVSHTTRAPRGQEQNGREYYFVSPAAFDAIVAEFGEGVVGHDGRLDRPKLGELVFADDAARTRLNAIVHPAVRELSRKLIERAEAEDPDAVVVYDVPQVADDYLRRVACAGAGGMVLSLVAPEEQPLLAALERQLGREFERETLAGFEDACAPEPAPAVWIAPGCRTSAPARPAKMPQPSTALRFVASSSLLLI